MSILVKCMNSNNDKAFFKLIKNEDELNLSLDSFIYSCLKQNYGFNEENLLVELIYPHHTEIYLEYNLDYISR